MFVGWQTGYLHQHDLAVPCAVVTGDLMARLHEL